MKKALSSIALVLGATIVTLVLAELLLRRIPVTRDSYIVLFRADPDFKFHYRPDQELETIYGKHITIDRYGHRRTEDHAREKPAGTYRILLLGDSVGFGLNVDDSELFTRGLAERLSEIAGRKVEVINGSCESYNTFNELAWYRKEGVSFQPDEVWLLFVSNDVGSQPSYFYVSPEGYSTETPDSLIPLSWRFQLRRSALALLAHQVVTGLAAGGAPAELAERPESLREPTITVLEKLVEEARARGRITVFFLPRRVEVETGERAAVGAWVAESAVRRGFPLHDVTPALMAATKEGRPPYLAHDPVHLSADGHAVLRQVMIDAFRSEMAR